VIQDSFGSPQNDSPRSEQRSQQVSGARLVNVPIPVFEPDDGQTDTGDGNADDAEPQLDVRFDETKQMWVMGISNDAKIPKVIQVDDVEIPVIPYIPPGSVEGAIAYQQKLDMWPRFRSPSMFNRVASVFNRVVHTVDTVTDWTPGTSQFKAAAKLIKGDYGDAVGLAANAGLPLPPLATLAVWDYQKDFVRSRLLTPKVLLGPLREPYDRIQGATKLDWRQALPDVATYVDIPKQLNAVYWDIRNGHPRQAYREAIDPVLATASVFGFLQPIKLKAPAALAAIMIGAGEANVFPTMAASSNPIAIVENGAGFYSAPARVVPAPALPAPALPAPALPAPVASAPVAQQIVVATPTGPSFAGVISIAAFENDPVIIDRLSRAREFDIGGYRSLTGSGLFGRVGDNLDSDEALQNAYIRGTFNVGRVSNLTRDNTAIALRPQLHRLIQNLRGPQLLGLTPNQALQFHLQQLRAIVPDYIVNMLEREAQAYIQRIYPTLPVP
jgi:hypothetical protein